MKDFQRLNNLAGWAVFLFALVVYTMTLESTASFWDCGEFIASAYKLEVVHPPGSPLFAIVGRVFTLFSPDNAAWMINFMSGLSSAFCILFTFWIVTYLARRALGKKGNELTSGERVAVIIAGAIAGMSGTFLDSFWFSAVEGEVYALAAFFTFAMLWAMTKWDENADKPYGDRWLVFIGLLVGLGVGVHLLHLLAIPALAFIYYFRRYEFSWRGAVVTFLIGFGLLAFVLWGVLDYYVRIGAWLDKIFTNSFGLPYLTGFFFFLVLSIGLSVFFIHYTREKGYKAVQLGLLSFIMIIIGFSSYTMVILRSNANPPVNMNEPKDPYTLHSYLKREQYGSRPLVYGPYFTAQPLDAKPAGKRYRYSQEEEKYIVAAEKTKYIYEASNLRGRIKQQFPEYGEDQINAIIRDYSNRYAQMNKMTLFPRMGSNLNQDHDRQYRKWLNMGPNDYPTFGDNIRFFFNYQLGYMYWRYFLWNFSGRQDDHQGHIDRNKMNGNWITGIAPIDKALVGAHLKQPDSMASDARNKYYLIPLILGLIGVFYHIKRNGKDAWVVFMFFIFTGIMNIVNSNQPPSEPRERDYAVAISFVSFAFWIGLGSLAIYERLRDSKLKESTAAYTAGGIALIVPLILGAQGWDDHDRSGRTLARDSAISYLETCAPNALLFTQGDNDTYPLWYLQEVEGIRTDVRVINLSLLAVDWYINQLHNKVNDADAVKLRYTYDNYMGDGLIQTAVEENQRYMNQYGNELDRALDYVKSQVNRKGPNPDQIQATMPIKNYTVTLDSAMVASLDFIPEKYRNNVVTQLKGRISRNSMVRDELILLDIIASNFPERPIYFSVTVDQRKQMGLERYMQREGLAWRLVPIDVQPRNPNAKQFNNSDLMYECVKKWEWGGLDESEVPLDETAIRTAKMLRGNVIFTAQLLQSEGDTARAYEMMKLAIEKYPQYNVPYTDPDNLFPVVNTLTQLNKMEDAKRMGDEFIELVSDDILYLYDAGEMENVRGRFGGGQDFIFRMSGQDRNQMGYYQSKLLNDVSLLNTMIDRFVNLGEEEYARKQIARIQEVQNELNAQLLNQNLQEL